MSRRKYDEAGGRALAGTAETRKIGKYCGCDGVDVRRRKQRKKRGSLPMMSGSLTRERGRQQEGKIMWARAF